MRSTRFVRGVIAIAVVGGLVLAGCGGDDDEGGDSTEPASAAPDDAFPVTVDHAQGSVRIERRPQRVVALGFADIQIARALDAPIVGAVQNSYGDDVNFLGVDPPLSSDVTTLDPATPNLEQITALDPDLILATTAQPAYGDAYEELSAIAPVVSYQNGLLEDSGEDLVAVIGTALGQAQNADALVQRSDDAVAAYAADHPELDGLTYAFGQHFSGATNVVVADDAPLVGLLGRLGMRLPDELTELPVDQPPGVATIAAENLGLLDSADVAFLGVPEAERDEFTGQPLVAGLDLARDEQLNLLTIDQTSLLLAPNPATTGAVLDLLDPLLEGVDAP